MSQSLRGHRLVAVPQLLDPNFKRTVILLLEHGDDGALGLVLNRPSELPVRGTIDEWAGVASDPPVIFVGGPVASSSVIALAEISAGSTSDDFAPISGPIGTVDLERSPTEIGAITRMRAFAGYAGWAPAQLEAELGEGGWFVVDLHPDDPFSSEPDDLWWGVLGRQGGDLGRLRHFPRDLADN
ncbi:MAG: YqgE/AlgH family protein [Acidimicrobiales bacterium]